MKIVGFNPSHIDQIEAYVADHQRRAEQPMLKQAEMVVTDFVSTNRRSMPERVIRFAPNVFQVPDKPVEPNVPAQPGRTVKAGDGFGAKTKTVFV
jgi:hypothetical protein